MTDYTGTIAVPCSKCSNLTKKPPAWFRSSQKLVLSCSFCGNDISSGAHELAIALSRADGNLTEFTLKTTGRK